MSVASVIVDLISRTLKEKIRYMIVETKDNAYLLSKQKFEKAGDVVTFTSFSRELFIGKTHVRTRSNKKKVDTSISPEDCKKKVFSRAKKRVSDYVNSNVNSYCSGNGVVFKSVFLTLTHADNVSDLDVAYMNFSLFVKRFNYFLNKRGYGSLKYVAVPEKQKRGSIHFHLVVFNMPFVSSDDIAILWSHGFVNIKSLRSSDNVGAYLTKYFSKDFYLNNYRNRKCYFVSRGLKKPVVVYVEELVHRLRGYVPRKAFVSSYVVTSEFCSMVVERYNLRDLPLVSMLLDSIVFDYY